MLPRLPLAILAGLVSAECFVQQRGERPFSNRLATRRGAASESAEAVDAALQRLLVLCTALQQPPDPAAESEPQQPALIARAAAASRAARSGVHGDGLFARADLAAGEVAALYPVHAVGIVGLLRAGEAHQLCMSADVEHFGSPDNFLLACLDGRPVRKGRVEGLLKAGSIRLGLPQEHVTSHSLRAGGASAMWAMGRSEAEIQFRGRWKSLCYKLYIWGSREKAKGFATGLFQTRPSLFAAVSAAVG